MKKVKSFVSAHRWWFVACVLCMAAGAAIDRALTPPQVLVEERVVEKVVEKVVEVEKKSTKQDQKTVVEKGSKKITKKKLQDGKVVEETVVEQGPEKSVKERSVVKDASRQTESTKESRKESEKLVVASPRPSWSIGSSVPARSVLDGQVENLSVEVGYRAIGPVWVTVSGTSTLSPIRIPSMGLGLRIDF